MSTCWGQNKYFLSGFTAHAYYQFKTLNNGRYKRYETNFRNIRNIKMSHVVYRWSWVPFSRALEHELAFSAALGFEQLQVLKYHKRVACPWWRGPASSRRVQVSWSLVDKRRWSVRATGGSVQQLCSRCTGPSWWRMSPKAKLFVYRAVCASFLWWMWTLGSDWKEKLEDTSGQKEVFLQGGSLRDSVRSSDTREELRAEPLLLLWRCSRDSMSLGWPEERQEVSVEREVWASPLRLLWPGQAKAGGDETRNYCHKRVTRSGKCVWDSSSSRVVAWCCWKCRACCSVKSFFFFVPE